MKLVRPGLGYHGALPCEGSRSRFIQRENKGVKQARVDAASGRAILLPASRSLELITSSLIIALLAHTRRPLIPTTGGAVAYVRPGRGDTR
jgi:hypothetical protein